MGRGLVRFGIDRKTRGLHPWPKLARKARMAPTLAQGLTNAGIEQGANPAEWCGLTRHVPLEAVAQIDVIDESGTFWETVHPKD